MNLNVNSRAKVAREREGRERGERKGEGEREGGERAREYDGGREIGR